MKTLKRPLKHERLGWEKISSSENRQLKEIVGKGKKVVVNKPKRGGCIYIP